MGRDDSHHVSNIAILWYWRVMSSDKQAIILKLKRVLEAVEEVNGGISKLMVQELGCGKKDAPTSENLLRYRELKKLYNETKEIIDAR